MIIKAISDTHNDHDKFDSKDLECDILIHAGDACIKGNYTEGLSFLKWLVKQPAKYKVVVWGNHDSKCKSNQELIDLAKEYGIIVLNRSGVEIGGVKLYGVCTTFMDIQRHSNYQVRSEAWETIPEGLDVLITHMPPFGVLDANEEGIAIGCPMLLNKLSETMPKYHLFGHCHEGRGRTEELRSQGKVTKCVNVASKDRQYNFTGEIFEFMVFIERIK